MLWLLLALAVTCGAVAPLQAGINSQLAKVFGHPVQAAVISFIVGTLAISLISFAFRVRVPGPLEVFKVSPILLTGGLLGVYMVMSSITAAPRLGAAVFISASVAGSMLASLLLDHYGIMGYAVKPITMIRCLGGILIVSGVFLVRGFE